MIRYYDYNESEDRLTVVVYCFSPDESPSLIIRCDSRALRFSIERKETLSLSQTCDEIYKLYGFLENPHWKSTLRADKYMRCLLENPPLL